MRSLLTIVAFILFIESIDFVQFLKWAAPENLFILCNFSENEESEEKKAEESEGKKIDKNFHQFYYSFNPDINGAQTFYIKNTILCPKGYDRTIYQPPKS